MVAPIFCAERLFFFVPRGCVIFLVPTDFVILFVPRGSNIFIRDKRLLDLICEKELHDFFLCREVA